MFRYGANNERLFQVICANHHPIKKEVIEEVEAIVNDES